MTRLELDTMCCGTGHLDGLVASGYRDAVAALGAYMKGAGPLSSGYTGGYQSQTYASPDVMASPLEQSVYQGGVVEYDLKVNQQGQVTGYMVVIKTPGPAVGNSNSPTLRPSTQTNTMDLPQRLGMNPPPRVYNVPMGTFAHSSNGPTSMVLYDAQTRELIHLDGSGGNGMGYESDDRVLRSSTQEHRVIRQEQIRKQILADLFNRPPVEQIREYSAGTTSVAANPQFPGAMPAPMTTHTDYSASSRLKQMIAKKKSELGVNQHQMDSLKERLLVSEAAPEGKHHVQFTHA